jgi:lipopolysaccharide/colanic/teichoic acid biosynthesis glycosyltransferase
MAKRVFDIVFASAGLLLTLPIFVVCWTAIRLEDGGPAFFRQIRVGRGGRTFEILKFRSMRIDPRASGPAITARGDPRITRIGRFLRRSKWDEIPQLWNVLRGDMSIVGPRPEVPRYVALYSNEQRAVLALRPGITDEASIEFKDEEKLLAAAPDSERFYVDYCMPKKIALNLAYAKRASVIADLQVIARTLRTIWFR